MEFQEIRLPISEIRADADQYDHRGWRHGAMFDEAAIRIGQRLVEHSAVPPSAAIVLVRISPDLTDGKSNFLKLHRI